MTVGNRTWDESAIGGTCVAIEGEHVLESSQLHKPAPWEGVCPIPRRRDVWGLTRTTQVCGASNIELVEARPGVIDPFRQLGWPLDP